MAESTAATSDATSNLCSFCSSLNLSRNKFMPNGYQESGQDYHKFDPVALSPVEIGYLDEIYSRRSSCAFCRLVYKATHSDDGRGIGHDGLDKDGGRIRCWMDWQLDGRYKTSMAITRRLHLYNKTGMFTDAHVVLVSDHASARDITDQPTFSGRLVKPTSADAARMRQWVSLCKDHHGVVCQSLNDVGASKASSDPLRLIDCNQMCLVELRRETRYATLSYCWGGGIPVVLICSTYSEMHELGALTRLFNELSCTIQDAIRLVPILGERYLWVDSLCIIQDSPDDWKRIAPTMDAIYGNSVVTICAASGSTAMGGLPGALPQPRTLVQQTERCGALNLMVVRPVEGHIRGSNWSSRAWTFQERLMSQRSLIFVDGRVFFQCRQATWSEELDCEAQHTTWNLDMIGSPLALLWKNPLRRYSNCVELYSGRQLTYYKDRLVAFDGIGALLREPLAATLHYGLPDSHFDWALLWELKSPGQFVGFDHIGSIFPSWSWSGWDSGVEWRFSAISGVLLQMHEWLVEHTWIVWYKGTPGSHELVWKRSSQAGPPRRWDGYSCVSGKTDPYGRSLASARKTPNQKTVPQATPREGCLHFWTYTAFFSLSRKSMSDAAFKSSLDPGLHRFGILDSKGDWCGTVVLDETWFNAVGGIYEFAAISDAKDFALEEYDSWTYYIPEEREQAEWYLYYALMIQWKSDVQVRLGLAKIYKTAFRWGSCEPGMQWKELTLG